MNTYVVEIQNFGITGHIDEINLAKIELAEIVDKSDEIKLLQLTHDALQFMGYKNYKIQRIFGVVSDFRRE